MGAQDILVIGGHIKVGPRDQVEFRALLDRHDLQVAVLVVSD
jgi:hypothetical protein